MQPIYMCDSCKKPIIGTVFSRDDLEMCLDCYWDSAGDPYNPPKFESKPTPQAYNSFAPADMVNNPAHYNQAGIECIDAMQAMVEAGGCPASTLHIAGKIPSSTSGAGHTRMASRISRRPAGILTD
jgi:hypothetical protein